MVAITSYNSENKRNFNIVAPMASADGYGYSAETLVKSAVYEHGANIGFCAHDWQDRAYTSQEVQDLEISRNKIDWREVLLIYFLPYALNVFRSQKNFSMTMFETTEIPQVWADIINYRADGLLVPSNFCKEVFAEKVTKPIEVFPLGVDTQTYYLVDRPESHVFSFLMTGLLHYRKGAEFAVKAFQEEFKSDEPVRLILKTRRGFIDYGNEEIKDGRITIVDADYSRKDMLDLYQAGDCFLAPSRGEASGLTPREAMATGLPVIATNWGGLTEICDSEMMYPLEIEGLEEAPAECSSYERGITQGQSIGQFAKPSVEHLRILMRHVYENQDEAKKKGFTAGLKMQSHWNYGVCSLKWLEAIDKLYASS